MAVGIGGNAAKHFTREHLVAVEILEQKNHETIHQIYGEQSLQNDGKV